VKTFRGDRGHGWFLLLVTPPPVSEDHLVPRDVILAIDTSGSMKGKKIDQAKASAHYLLENLRPVDRVNVLAFSSSVEPFAAEPVPATPGNLGKIRKFVAGIKAMGGTAIADALKEALDVKKTEGRVRTVVFLTDGCPTVGEIRPEEIVKMARAGRASGLRVFPFGVGEDVDAGLLGGIAEATRGRAEIFRPGGEIETRLRRFLDRTSAPVLAGLTVSVPGSRDVFPRPLPDVYLGEQVAVVGRYIEGGLREIRVSATAGTRKTCLTTVADFQAAPGGSTAVRDLFARMKLDFLERQLRLRGGLSDDAYYAALDRGAYSTEDEITGEIISVSLEHGVQSAYTSFLALLPEDRHRIDPRDADALRKALARVARVRGKVARASQPVEEESIQEEEPIEEAEIVDEFVEEMELEDDTVAEQSFEARYSKAAIGLGSAAGGYLGGRRGAQRGLRRRYRGQGTATGVDMGLAWLARAQQPDGSWPQTSCTTANTGLALLAFLGAGHTHQAGSHKQVLGSGLKYLRRIQDAEGCFGGRKDLRAHAIATLAVAEAYCLTHSPLLRRCVEKGIDYLVRTTLPPGDSHATVWAVLAFVAARDAGIPLKKEVFDRARTRLDSINSREDAIGAAVVFARILLGENPDTSERIQRGVKRLLEALARHEAALATRREVEFWYFGTFAMFQVGGSKWGRFNRSMKAAIVDSQEKTGDRKGAWVPTGSRAATLGPVGSTALFTMCLEVYFRYGRVFGTR